MGHDEALRAGDGLTTDYSGRRVDADKLIPWLAASWGFCTFFPVGVGYLHLFTLALVMGFSPHRRARAAQLLDSGFKWPLLLFILWPLAVAVTGPWYDATAARLFHVMRGVLILGLALMLRPAEARAALHGFLVAAGFAVCVVALHHAIGLPHWALWHNLLESKGNQSSQNMILLAVAAGLSLARALRPAQAGSSRLLWLAFMGLLATAVVFHAMSRNAQLILAAVLMFAVLHRYRSRKGLIIGLALSLVAVALAWQYSPTTHARFMALWGELQQAQQSHQYASSIGVRWRMYQECLQAMIESPLFGKGLGSWLVHWQAVAAGQLGQLAQTNNPHNDYLLAGMETGVPGMLVVIWLLLAFAVKAWAARTEFGAEAFLLATAVIVTTMFNPLLRDAAFGLSLLWLMGAAAAAARTDNVEAARPLPTE